MSKKRRTPESEGLDQDRQVIKEATRDRARNAAITAAARKEIIEGLRTDASADSWAVLEVAKTSAVQRRSVGRKGMSRNGREHQGPLRAVLYLRVSTLGQAHRGGEPEGYSLPAQREACRRLAKQKDWIVIEEYVEPGLSARTDKRPVFQEMLTRIRDTGDVDVIIIWSLSRLSRRRLITSKLMEECLVPFGVNLVSVRENFDYSTPNGRLTMHIMDDVNQYQSEDIAVQVVQGSAMKANYGGTPYRAPLGYLNDREVDPHGSKDIRNIIVDPQRVDLVRWCLNQFATGEWTGPDLLAEATKRGLTNRPTRTSSAKPLSLNGFYNMLRHPYYMGVVPYNGKIYRGKHDPLITPTAWLKIQDLLDAHAHRGEKNRRHPHYLRGSIYCSECRERLCFTRAKGNGGSYDYFFCVNKRRHGANCVMKHVKEAVVEAAVEDYYERLQIAPARIKDILDSITHELDLETTAAKHERQQQQRRLARLEDERRKAMHAHYQGAIPLDLLEEEVARIARQMVEAQDRIKLCETTYDSAQETLVRALNLARDCQRHYKGAPNPVRRQFNQGFFKQIFIGPDGKVVSVDLHEPFKTLLRDGLVEQIKRDSQEAQAFRQGLAKEARRRKGRLASGEALASWHGLNKRTVVAPAGFEPAVSTLRG